MNWHTPLRRLLVGAVALLMLSGCDLAEVNDNPNSPTESTTAALLSNGQRDLGFETYGDNASMRGSNLWAQYTTQNFYPQESRYQSVNYGWENVYNALNDLKTAKQKARANGDGNTAAVALITQMWAFHILTDTYGDIPFTEALRESESLSPTYTPQEEIYPALVDSLDAALSEMNADGAGPEGDLFLGGDMAKWAKFANALKMRIGIRMVDANRSEAEAAITSGNDGALESNADNIYFQFATSSQHRNTLYENQVVDGRDDFDAADRFVNAMKQYDTDDPRVDAYFTPSCLDGVDYKGFAYGLEQGDAQSRFARQAKGTCENSRHNDYFAGGPSGEGDALNPILYYDEVLFIRAEAAARGILPGNPKALLEEAIKASIDWYGQQTGADISSDDAATEAYVSAVMDDYDANGYEQVIGEQKWIALYFNDVQGWSTWRRLDFSGHLKPPAGGTTGNLNGTVGNVGVPLRADYPQTEFSRNGENVRNAAMRQFENIQNENPGSALWWDVEEPPADAFVN